MLSEITGAVSYTSIKKIENVNVFTLSYIKIVMIFGVGALYMIFQIPFGCKDFLADLYFKLDPITFMILFLIALGDIVLNLLMFKTFELEKAGVGASMNFLCLIWSLIIDVMVFD